MNPFLKNKLALTIFVVEASDFERWCLREKYGRDWAQDMEGNSVKVGEFGDMPVIVSLTWEIIFGHRVLFWEGVSAVVNHFVIDEWFLTNCNPRWDGENRRAACNAMNFHLCLEAITELKGASK